MISAESIDYQCAHCGEWNETMFDPSGGDDQRFVEDCAVCCHPLVLHLRVDAANGGIRVEVEEES